MLLDSNGMEVLGREQCLDLLRTQPIARVGVSVQALPVVVPVNFVLHGDDIVIRSAAGSKLSAACDRSVVAVEVDDYDALEHTGWSVLVRGPSRVIDDPAEVERARGLWLRPWANERAERWIAIATDLVSGRRIRRPGAVEVSPDLAVGDLHPI